MKAIHPADIEPSVSIHSESGEIPFIVAHLPRVFETVKGAKQEMMYDGFYLRTAPSLDVAVKETLKEFNQRGFLQKQVDATYSAGVLRFDNENVVVVPDTKYVKGLNFVVPEGLVGTHYKGKKKVVVERELTKRLYLVHFGDAHKCIPVNDDLAQIVTRTDDRAVIFMSRAVKQDHELSQMARAHVEAKQAVYNNSYGGPITYFSDPDTQEAFQIVNEKRSKDDVVGIVLSEKIKGSLHGQLDKVPGGSRYFFDGTLQDLFKILKEKGIKFEDGIVVE